MREGLEQGRHLGAGKGQRLAVGHVDEVGAAGAQQALQLAHPLQRRDVHGHDGALEDVGHDQVALPLAQPRQLQARVTDPEAEAGGPEAGPHQLRQRLVGLDDQLARAGPRGRDVPGERAAAAPQVHGGQRSRGQGVDDVPHEPDVVELQAGGVGPVDVGLRHAIDRQQPAVLVVGVPQQLGLPEGDRPAARHGAAHGRTVHVRGRSARSSGQAASKAGCRGRSVTAAAGTQRRSMLSWSGTTGSVRGTVATKVR